MPDEGKIDIDFIDPPKNLPFELEDDEKFVAELRPVKTAFILRNSAVGLAAAVLISAALLLLLFDAYPLIVLAAIIILFLIVLIPSFVSYNMYRYWITSDRIIGSRGFVAYSIDSIPVETIADVVLNRSFTDIVLGVSSLYIVPMGSGGSSIAKPGGGVTQLSSVNYLGSLERNRAEHAQKLIFELRAMRKKEL